MGTKSSIKTRKIKSIDDVKDQDGTPLFYVTNYDSTGFAIISGDNRIQPILAFSNSHSFKMDQEMLNQTGLGYWIEATENGIRNIRKQNLKQSAKMKALWGNQQGLKNAPPDNGCHPYYYTKGPLLQTTWGQGCGYNSLLQDCSTPYYCYHAVTGCVATAMAQVMKYHTYPASYNWSGMPDTYGTTATATLMRDIGLPSAVNMNYGCSGSIG